MKNLLLSAIVLIFTTVGYSQAAPCPGLPVMMPDEIAKAENADAHFQSNMPASIAADENTSGIFKVLVDCDNSVGTVLYTDGAMTDPQAADIIEVVKTLDWTAAVKDGDAAKTYVFISLKISAGQASCAIN